jgi:hypothetical protein
MLALLAAVALPALYWDQGPATAGAVKQAGIERLYVPASEEAAWKAVGLDAKVFEAVRFVKLSVLSAHQIDGVGDDGSPIDANGWRFQRNAGVRIITTPAGQAMLAGAEAFANRVEAVIHVDPKDWPGSRMLVFYAVSGEDAGAGQYGVIDNGSADGEIMNLARRNLLFQVSQGRSEIRLNHSDPLAKYSTAEAANPVGMAA